MSKMGKYVIPKIVNIKLNFFSIFSKKGEERQINEDISDGVYCLAGANGLGKSTFLNAINYGLTGIILDPDLNYLSQNEIVKSCKNYTERYFDGRINSNDKNKANIEIEFLVENKKYKIRRYFFKWQELDIVNISQDVNEKQIVINSKNTKDEIMDIYQKNLCNDTGFQKFEDYIFFQLYVFTFDESRSILLWNERGLQTALSLTFFSDQNDSTKLIDLQRCIDKHSSNARNKRWHATQIRKKIESLSDFNSDIDKDNLNNYIIICDRIERIEKTIENIESEKQNIIKRQAELTYELSNLRNEYKKLFQIYAEPKSKLTSNEYINISIEKKQCILCSAKGESISEAILNSINKNSCPLCNTKLIDSIGITEDQKQLLYKIEKIDSIMSKKNANISQLYLDLSEKELEYKKYILSLKQEQSSQKEYETRYSISKEYRENIVLEKLANQYKEEYEQLNAEADKEYIYRDKLKPEYNKLQIKLAGDYKNAEISFLPMFQELAEKFIGLKITVEMKTKSNNIVLELGVNDQVRTEFYYLSESQRFFMDIALRMAISMYISKSSNGATVYIDTPEGSLDIAYERRAGIMLSDFILNGHNIVMTANINASRLLISLANNCKNDKMKVKRLIDWTELSEVQKDGEDLFNKIFQDIDEALK